MIITIVIHPRHNELNPHIGKLTSGKLPVPMVGDYIRYDDTSYQVVERIFNYDTHTVKLVVNP